VRTISNNLPKRLVGEKKVQKKKVLIVGIYGIVGGLIYRHFAEFPEKYDLYGLDKCATLSPRAPRDWEIAIPEDRFFLADITDLDTLENIFRKMDVVIHLAGAADPDSSWEGILSNNITGTYNVFEACKRSDVKRIIYASSLRILQGYFFQEPYKSISEGRFESVPDRFLLIDHEMPPRPVDLYSAGKVWGEGLARMYSDQYGVSCICLRLGWVNDDNQPREIENMTLWTSHADMQKLVELCVDGPEAIRFEIFFGVSNARYRWVDIDYARKKIGYVPKDWAEDFLKK
jgi:nucleoside-diphosphate-sugar epimerase